MSEAIPQTVLTLGQYFKKHDPELFLTLMARFFIPSLEVLVPNGIDIDAWGKGQLITFSGKRGVEVNEIDRLWFEESESWAHGMIECLEGLANPEGREIRLKEFLIIWRDRVKSEREKMSEGEPVKTVGDLLERIGTACQEASTDLEKYLREKGLSLDFEITEAFLDDHLAPFEENRSAFNDAATYAFWLAHEVNYAFAEKS
jgi:hypothetical protein